MNKKTMIKALVSAGAVCTIAFLSYKAYKILQEHKENEILTDEVNKQLLAKRLTDQENARLKLLEEARQEELDEMEEEDANYVDPREVAIQEIVAYYGGSEEDEEGDVKILRYDVDSLEALKQYKDMRLADLAPISRTKAVMMNLFSRRFEPLNEHDENILKHIRDSRTEFFGPNSKWLEGATLAELILYFAELTDFDIDGGGEFWTTDFINNLGISIESSPDQLDEVFDDLLFHDFYSRKGFGLFCLDGEAMDKVDEWDKVNNRNRTFLGQYNVFISTKLAEIEDEDYYGEDEDYYGEDD